ncbi:MAG: GNAT family N-acetyltransferase [Stenotrophobium sp.]
MSSVQLVQSIDSDRDLTIDFANAGDAWFLLTQVILGADSGSFSRLNLLKTEQVKLLKSCCYALLRRAWHSFLGRRPPLLSPGYSFLAARHAGTTVGAALVKTERHDEMPSVYIDTVVVDRPWQGRGVGGQLLKTIMERAPMPSLITCACAPDAQAMMHLLKRHDFRKVRSFKKVRSILLPKLFEYRKQTFSNCEIPPRLTYRYAITPRENGGSGQR